MSKTTAQAAKTFNIKVESYPNWDTPPEKRLESVRCSLKHYGFRPLAITAEGSQPSINWRDHERRIEGLRTILQPKPVTRERLPKWFVALVKDCRDRRGITSKECPLQRQWEAYQNLRIATGLPNVFSLFDHWGKCDDVVVVEPYMRREHIETAFQLADLLDCDVWFSPNSWHFPGRTTRIEFSQREGDARHE